VALTEMEVVKGKIVRFDAVLGSEKAMERGQDVGLVVLSL
jgi:hypothetical protein